MTKTKFSIATCRILLGVGLILGTQSLYAQTIITNTNIKDNFEKSGNNITFTGNDFDIELGATSTRNWGGDVNISNIAYDPEVNLFDAANALNGSGGGSFQNFNARNESIVINAGNGNLTLIPAVGGADTLNNFTLTSKSDDADAISATDIYFRALSGVSSFNGNTEIDRGGLYVDGGSIVVNGDLALTGAKLGFNTDRLNAIQVRGNANLGTLNAGDIQLSSTSIKGFDNAILVNVTGEGNALTANIANANVGGILQIDDRRYLGADIDSLKEVGGAGTTVSFADFLKSRGENFSSLLDLSTFVSYQLNTNATQLRINGGANGGVLGFSQWGTNYNQTIVDTIKNVLDKYADSTNNTGLLYEFAAANGIDITPNANNNVRRAIDAIEEQTNRLNNIINQTYVEKRLVNGQIVDTPLTLVESRNEYDIVLGGGTPTTAGATRESLKYTRNDIFAQSIGGISQNNQNIVARYLDGLETKLGGRVTAYTLPNGSPSNQIYSVKDLYTQDAGFFKVSPDGRIAQQVDENGNEVTDANGNPIWIDNGAVLDAIARIKLENVGNTLANQYREGMNAIADSNSATSLINQVINIATDVSISSRIVANNNPYTYAQKISKLKFAAIASDRGGDYVDNYINGIWVNAFGGVNRIDGENGNIYGVNLGLDRIVTDNLLLGAYFTYANSEVKYNVLNQENDNFQVGIYSSIQVAPLWELNLKAFGQISPTNQTRWDVLGVYDSDFTRRGFGFNANIGRYFGLSEDTFIKPFVGANYYLTYTPSYTENGIANPYVANLDIDGTTNNNISLEFGAEFRQYFNASSYFFIIPKIEQYIVNSGLDFTATLNNIAIEDVTDANKKKTYAQAILGGNFNLNENFSANIGLGVKQILSGKVYNKNETYGVGQAGVRYKF